MRETLDFYQSSSSPPFPSDLSFALLVNNHSVKTLRPSDLVYTKSEVQVVTEQSNAESIGIRYHQAMKIITLLLLASFGQEHTPVPQPSCTI